MTCKACFGMVIAITVAVGTFGCGHVEVVSGPSGSGGGGATTGVISSNEGGGGEGGSGEGGTGATTLPDDTLGAPLCEGGEVAMVVAASATETLAIAGFLGKWSPAAGLGPSRAAVAYVDAYGAASALWLGIPGDPHFARTVDGATFEHHDALTFLPSPEGPLRSTGAGIVAARTAEGMRAGFFDPDAFDFTAGPPSDAYLEDFSVALVAKTAEVVFAGRGPAGQLCLQSTFYLDWQPLSCLDGVITKAGEIPPPAPAVVALPNGDLAVVYHPTAGFTSLAAVVRQAGSWSAPVAVKSDAIGWMFAAAPTPSGDVLVGSISGNVLSTLRFSPSSGWSAPVPLDDSAHGNGPLAAARGNCGDDALFAYAAGNDVKLARVRGALHATEPLASFGEENVASLSLATLWNQTFPQ